MQSDEVGVDLLAHTHKGLDARVADFISQQPRYLDYRGYRRRLWRRDVGDTEGDQRGDRKGETDCLNQLRDEKIRADPVVAQFRIEPTADRDHRKAEHD